MNEQELKEQLKQEIKQEMKKSARKKRIIIFAIILLIIAALLIYLTIEFNKSKELYRKYTYEEISQYKKEIPITAENWKEYVITEDATEEYKDAFGNITRKDEKTTLKLKDNICGYLILQVKVSKKQDDEKQIITIVGQESGSVLRINGEKRQEGDIIIYNDRYILDDLELVQLKGSIYTIDIPEDMWKTQNDTKRKYILLKEENSNAATYLYKDKLPGEADYIYILSQIDYEKYDKQINE